MYDIKVQKKYWATEKGKLNKRKYRISKKGKETHEKYVLNNSEKIIAQGIARQLPSKTCEIKSCEVRGEKHHADYSKPLEVTYLCSKHHKTKHKRLRQREPQRPN